MPYCGLKPFDLTLRSRKSVGILGCGWLGLALARHLRQLDYTVKGSTRSLSSNALLAEQGIEGYLLRLQSEGLQGDWTGFIEGVSILIISIPPGLRKNPEADFVNRIKHLIKALEKVEVERVLFVSSTSVYGSSEARPGVDQLNEQSAPNPLTESARQLLQVEELLLENKSFETTILRPGGLLGPDRHPVRMLSGRKNLRGGNQPVNLIQRQEILEIISLILNDRWEDKRINLVYPQHPLKKDYYTRAAKQYGLAPPEYTEEKGVQGLSISPDVVLKHGYSFAYPIDS